MKIETDFTAKSETESERTRLQKKNEYKKR